MGYFRDFGNLLEVKKAIYGNRTLENTPEYRQNGVDFGPNAPFYDSFASQGSIKVCFP